MRGDMMYNTTEQKKPDVSVKTDIRKILWEKLSKIREHELILFAL